MGHGQEVLAGFVRGIFTPISESDLPVNDESEKLPSRRRELPHAGIEGLKQLLTEQIPPTHPVGKLARSLEQTGGKAPLDFVTKTSGMSPDEIEKVTEVFSGVFIFDRENTTVSCPPLITNKPDNKP